VHALAAATSARRETVVRTLLSHGVAPDLRMPGGATSLILAAALGQARIVEALLEAGAAADARDEHGTCPLLAAAQFAFEGGDAAAARAVIERLLAAGADIAACNGGGQDVLLVLLGARAQAGTRCDAEQLRRLAEFLLERGARTDRQDLRGVGPLHACALHGLSGCARLLKAHGASTTLLDAFGRSAADVASMLGFADVAGELGAERTALPGVRQTLRRPARAPD
jgi:ankyrin repeat protein